MILRIALISLSLVFLTITSAGCPGTGTSGSGSGSGSGPVAKECAQQNPTDCEKAGAIASKVCRFHQNKCLEVKTCPDLTPIGQAACKTDVFTNEKCTWMDNKCLIESKLLADFKSTAKAFKQDTNVGHSEIADTFMWIAGSNPNYNYNSIKFDFGANKEEVAFNVKPAATNAWSTPYNFTYKAADLDGDTMLIELKGTTPKSGTVFMVPNVNVVEPFERAVMMYQKSTNKLFFLIVYKKSDMDKFAVNKPADFVIDTSGSPTDLKGRAEPHAALIMTP